MEKQEKLLKKRISKFHGKKIFLLGQDEHKINYWLVEASWDCDWYWGFGYIQTYTNNANPSIARDITTHDHAENFMSEYFTEWNNSNPILRKMTFTEKEGWELSELFKQYYLLRETAEYFYTGNCHVAKTSIKTFKKPELVQEINVIILPEIFSRIYEILTPITPEKERI